MPRLPRAPVALAVVLAFGGCDRLQELIEERVQEEVAKAKRPPPPNPEPTAAGEPEELLQQKLDLYVVCLGRSRRDIGEAWKRYAEDIDVDKGTPLRRSSAPFVRRIDAELTACREAARRGPGMPPPLPELEDALDAYLLAAETFAGLTAQLNAYYDARGYEKDGWAKGKALAGPFAAAFSSWETTASRLQMLVDQKKDEADIEMLALVERRSGRGLDYLSRAFVIAAKGSFRCAAPDAASPPETAHACGGDHEAREAAHRAFEGHVEAHPEQAQEVFWMDSFRSAVADFMVAARRHTEARAKHRSADEARERVENDYRELVQAANNLRFDFPRSELTRPRPTTPRAEPRP